MATPLTQTTGRRKEAIARARLRPGTGTITVNGRPFDAYFTTPAHRMEASEPLRVAEATERFDVDATITRWRRQRPGRRPAHGARPLARRARARDARHAQEGRPPHPRLAEEGEQEVRPQEGPQGAAVHQALIARGAARSARCGRAMKFGTDGVRGVANIDLTASFALDLGRAAARVLGGSEAVVGGDTRLSTAMLEAAFVAGLASEGVVGPPPRRRGRPRSSPSRRPAAAASGAVISASHNPYRDNGIKLFAPGGTQAPRRGRAAHRGGRRRPPGARPVTRPSSSTSRPARPTSSTSCRRARGPPPATGCGSSSTPPTAPPARSPARCPDAAGADGRRHPRRRPTGATSTPGAAPPTPASLAAAVVAARRRPRPRPRRRRRPAARRRPHRRRSSTATTSSAICAIDLPRAPGGCATTRSS